jgi:predicted transcriptional regulator
MEVHFSPEQEAQLAQVAAHAGIGTEHLVRDAALRVVDETAAFRAAIREGVQQADRGELVEDGDVLKWLESQERR